MLGMSMKCAFPIFFHNNYIRYIKNLIPRLRKTELKILYLFDLDTYTNNHYATAFSRKAT